jgi:hypothetical protein
LAAACRRMEVALRRAAPPHRPQPRPVQAAERSAG